MSERATETKPQPEIRRVGYGLPCAKCNTYYFADLKECPVCHARERTAQLAVKTFKMSPTSTHTTEVKKPTPAKLVEIKSEKRSTPSVTAIPKVTAAPIEASAAISEAKAAPSVVIPTTVAGAEESILLNKIAVVEIQDKEHAAGDSSESHKAETTPAASEKKLAKFAPGSLDDCWSIIMGRDRSVAPASMPELPKEIAADDFSARCVKTLEEIYISGETVVITSMGRPVAKIVPLADDELKPTGS